MRFESRTASYTELLLKERDISWGTENDVVSVRVTEETLSKDNLSTKDPLQRLLAMRAS